MPLNDDNDISENSVHISSSFIAVSKERKRKACSAAPSKCRVHSDDESDGCCCERCQGQGATSLQVQAHEKRCKMRQHGSPDPPIMSPANSLAQDSREGRQGELDERRALEDGWTYTIEEVKAWYMDDWELEWERARRVVKTAIKPPGLMVANVHTSCASGALQELMPFLEEGNGRRTKFEIGWQTYVTYDANDTPTSFEAAALGRFPCLRKMLHNAMHTLGGTQSLDDRLSVLCWRYGPGASISLHYDQLDFFEEDVFGCVLGNSSNRTLEFHEDDFGCKSDQQYYVVPEQPGTCYWMKGPSRYEWRHGIALLTQGERVSVTWRWFNPSVKLMVSASGASQ